MEFVRHAARPAWGVGRVTDVYAGLMRVRFSDGVTREFRADVLEAMSAADAPLEMLAEPTVAPPPPSPSRAAARRPRKAPAGG